MPVWVIALVIAALAPTLVRLAADWLERRARARTHALLASAGVPTRSTERRGARDTARDTTRDTTQPGAGSTEESADAPR